MTTYEKLVKGATKIKMAPPKAKYIEPILIGTGDPQDFREIIRALDNRLHDTAFTICYKSLIVVHLMMREGGISNANNLTLKFLSNHPEFFEQLRVKANPNDSMALKKYAQYLQVRSEEYNHTDHIDYVRQSPNEMNINDPGLCLDHVESLERQISSLIKNRYSQLDLTSNNLLMTCFRLLIQDLLSLYNALNEGIINLLESFFELSKPMAERTLQLYKNFVELTEDAVKYLKVGKSCGMKIPVIKHITTKLISSLEEHLRQDNGVEGVNGGFNNGNSYNSDNYNDNRIKTPAEQLEEIRKKKEMLQRQLKENSRTVSSSSSPPPPTGVNGSAAAYNPFGTVTGPANETFSFEPAQQQLQAQHTASALAQQQAQIQAQQTSSLLAQQQLQAQHTANALAQQQAQIQAQQTSSLLAQQQLQAQHTANALAQQQAQIQAQQQAQMQAQQQAQLKAKQEQAQLQAHLKAQQEQAQQQAQLKAQQEAQLKAQQQAQLQAQQQAQLQAQQQAQLQAQHTAGLLAQQQAQLQAQHTAGLSAQQQAPIQTATTGSVSNPFLQRQNTGFYSSNHITPSYTGAGFGGFSSQQQQQQPALSNNLINSATMPIGARNISTISTSATTSTLPMQPMKTGSNNPFSLDNISKKKTEREAVNPFSVNNFKESPSVSALMPTIPATNGTGNPFSLNNGASNTAPVFTNVNMQQQNGLTQQPTLVQSITGGVAGSSGITAGYPNPFDQQQQQQQQQFNQTPALISQQQQLLGNMNMNNTAITGTYGLQGHSYNSNNNNNNNNEGPNLIDI
ncbi:uncharacterized protein SCODWIG_02052 [Saccharomycodes ludwigii]|uniref:ENTH domain-containing protein n=1 Tax=Saccharomycodes ludwigii TaxID=36035 RepID=A0A376B6M9_9ASCO|nr:uncharacterized protein SCODWIG_02052 [Saccharomycodes ludwigii]